MTHTSDVEALAREAAGNHLRFESFGWHDRPEDSENWTIVYTDNRDSGLLDQSNAAAIKEILEPFTEGDDPDVQSERHGHWGCGWVDGYSIRVYRNGQITEAFRKWREIHEALSDYPVLDEEDYSRREYEATLENIQNAGGRFVSDEAPKDWASEAFSWFWEHNQSAVESVDDQGGYPSDSEIKECLEALGYLSTEYLEDED